MTRPASFASFRFKVPALGLVPALSTVGLGVALALSTAACSSSSGGNTGGATATGGTSSTGGATATGGTSSTGGTGQGGNATGGQTSTGGTPATGGSGGGATGGKGGSSSTGGSSSGGSGGGSTGGSSGGGSSGNGQCPTNATFCSGFEDTGLPVGITYLADRDFGSNGKPDWTKGVTIDPSQKNGGKQSAKFLAHTGKTYFSVAAASEFWMRSYLMTDVAVGPGTGHDGHDAFFEAGWDTNDAGIQIVEENCQLGININDTRYGTDGMVNGSVSCPTAGTTLMANKWYCIEGHFDSAKGDFEIFVDGTSVLSRKADPKATFAGKPFTALHFGYYQYHDISRNNWYDDVAVAPQRIGCLPKQ